MCYTSETQMDRTISDLLRDASLQLKCNTTPSRVCVLLLTNSPHRQITTEGSCSSAACEPAVPRVCPWHQASFRLQTCLGIMSAKLLVPGTFQANQTLRFFRAKPGATLVQRVMGSLHALFQGPDSFKKLVPASFSSIDPQRVWPDPYHPPY